MRYDVAILGGGPGGYVAAIRAGKQGLKTILFEKSQLGGVCLNRGCIPTKALLHSAQVCWQASRAEHHGLVCEIKQIDTSKAMSRKDEVVATLRSGIAALLRKSGVEIVRSEATLYDKHTVMAQGVTWESESIILATGSQPLVAPELVGKVLTSDEFLALSTIPDSVAIVGGGVIGVEFATMLSGFGCQVSLLEATERILPSADPQLSQTVAQGLCQRGVTIYNGVQNTQYSSWGLDFDYRGEQITISSKAVLLSVGRTPNVPVDTWEQLGIQCDGGRVVVDAQMRTTVHNIYAIGDIVQGPMLAHKASAEGVVAVDAITGGMKKMRYDRIPSCVYSIPEAAWIGVSAQQAVNDSKLRVVAFPMSHNGKSLADDASEGFVQLVASDATGEIVGAQLVCSHASDLIGEIALAMQAEACIEDIADIIAPHPSVGEAIAEAALSFCNRAVHGV